PRLLPVAPRSRAARESSAPALPPANLSRQPLPRRIPHQPQPPRPGDQDRPEPNMGCQRAAGRHSLRPNRPLRPREIRTGRVESQGLDSPEVELALRALLFGPLEIWRKALARPLARAWRPGDTLVRLRCRSVRVPKVFRRGQAPLAWLSQPSSAGTTALNSWNLSCPPSRYCLVRIKMRWPTAGLPCFSTYCLVISLSRATGGGSGPMRGHLKHLATLRLQGREANTMMSTVGGPLSSIL